MMRFLSRRLGPASMANQISILSVPENLMWIIRDLVTIIMSYRMWQLDSQVLGIYMVSLKKPPGSREVSPAGQSYHCRIACICRLQSVPIPGLSVSLLCYVASATPARFHGMHPHWNQQDVDVYWLRYLWSHPACMSYSYIPYMTQRTIRVNGASKACFLACHQTVPLHA